MNQPWPYTVRPMEPRDVPTVIAIEKLSYPTPWPASSYLYELKHNTRASYYVLLKPPTGESAPSERGWRRWLRSVLGLPHESRVIGYVGFRLQSDGIHVSTIAIHPDWRGRGLGELLLLTTMEQSLELEATLVSLEVRISNRTAQRLYRKYGFQFKSIQQGYYRDGEDAWLMEAEMSRGACRAQLTGLRQTLYARLCRQQADVRADVGQNDGDGL